MVIHRICHSIIIVIIISAVRRQVLDIGLFFCLGWKRLAFIDNSFVHLSGLTLCFPNCGSIRELFGLYGHPFSMLYGQPITTVYTMMRYIQVRFWYFVISDVVFNINKSIFERLKQVFNYIFLLFCLHFHLCTRLECYPYFPRTIAILFLINY